MRSEQPMHGGAMQSPRQDDSGALEHADEDPDRTSRTFALDAHNLLGEFLSDGPAAAAIGAVLGKQSLKAAAAIGVIPALDGAGGELHMGAIGLLLLPRGCFLEVAATIAVLQARTDKRTQNPEPPKGDFFFFLLPHAPTIDPAIAANLGGFFVLFGVVPTTAETPAAYKRRIFGCNR